jgi:Xaa-Pro aminopeptidase
MKYQSRMQKLQKMVQENQVDAFLIEDVINLYYLTGLHLSAGKLLVTPQGATLFVDARYLELCQMHSPFPVLLADPSNFQLWFVKPEFSFIRRLAFESDKTTYHSFLQLKTQLEASCNIQLIPLNNLLSPLRAIKDEDEIQALREAAELGSLGFDFLCSFLKEGISEIEAAMELEIFWKRLGGRSVAFDPIIAFGSNSSMPHYRAGKERLKNGEIVLMDIGVNLNHYHSDMTRMAFFGKADPTLLSIHEIVQEAQNAALLKCQPGSSLGTLDLAARTVIKEHGYGANFTHSLGHGLGLEVHEYPTIRNVEPVKDLVLAPGMVITIEPGIYIPSLGGVRIEDTVLISETGYENLTNRSSNPVYLPKNNKNNRIVRMPSAAG